MIVLESDPVTDLAAQRLQDKHPINSVIVERNNQGQQIIVAGDPQSVAGKTKIELVGHRNTALTGIKALGGLDAQELANEVIKVSDQWNQDRGLALDIGKVSAVGCDTGSCINGQSLAAGLDASLKAQGIHTEVPVKGYQGLIDVTAGRHKRSTAEGGLGKTRPAELPAPAVKKEDIYVYLDKLPAAGSSPNPMYGNFSGLVRQPNLWHPAAGPEQLKALMGSGEYSERLFLVGMGFQGGPSSSRRSMAIIKPWVAGACSKSWMNRCSKNM